MQNNELCPGGCGFPPALCRCKRGGGSDDSVEDDRRDDYSLTTNYRNSFTPFTDTNSGYTTGSIVPILLKHSILTQGQDSNISEIEKGNNSITLQVPSLGVIKLTFDPNVLQKNYDPDHPLTLETFGKLTGLMILDRNGDPLDSQTAKDLLANQEFLQIAGEFSEDQQTQLNIQNIDNTF